MGKSIAETEPLSSAMLKFPDVVRQRNPIHQCYICTKSFLNSPNLHEHITTIHMTSLKNHIENFSEKLTTHINEYHEAPEAVPEYVNRNQMSQIESYFHNTTKFQEIKPLIKRKHSNDKNQLNNYHLVYTGKRGRPKRTINPNLYQSLPGINIVSTDEVLKKSSPTGNVPTYYKFKTKNFEENGHYIIKVDNSVCKLSYQDERFRKYMEDGNIYDVVELILKQFLGQDLSNYNLSGIVGQKILKSLGQKKS